MLSASADPRLKYAKGITRDTLKARDDRHEAQVKRINRAKVKLRDGDCCLSSPAAQELFGRCMGTDEWNHLEKRSKTRNQSPEERHATGITCMACSRHHKLIDDGDIKHRFLTKAKADGPMVWQWKGKRARLDEREHPRTTSRSGR